MCTRLLHVEDDLDILEIARLSLELSGDFEVMQCSAPAEALALVDRFAPEVLLLDVMMPGMTGDALLAELRLRPALADTPAIFMTARVQPQEIKALIEKGARDVIVKPFDPMTLAAQIRDILARP